MVAVPAPAPVPTTDEVIAISAIHDPVVRNLRITECYHRLSLAMAARTGPGANWCTFATWASRQAGRTVRGEDFLERLAAHARPGWTLLHPIKSLWRALLRKGIFNPETAAGRLVRAAHSPFDAFERASDAVARGNLKVFEEIGLEFARYVQSCECDTAVQSDPFTAFLASFRIGMPPQGQDCLRRAFTHYQQLGSEPGAGARAQLMLLANLEIGLHEQTRLQPEIQEALEAVPDTAEDLGARVLRVLAPRTRVLALFRRPLGFILRRYRLFARELTRRAITDSLMVLALADVVLALGRNLESPFPDVLQNLTHPELCDLWNGYELQNAAGDNCGAKDWADLRQRMHYILHLFRAFHLHAALSNPPLTAAQIQQLMSGNVPDGDL